MIDFGQCDLVDDYRAMEWLVRMGGEAWGRQYRVDSVHDLGAAADFESVELLFAHEVCLCPSSPNLSRMMQNGWVELTKMEDGVCHYRLPASAADHHAFLADLRERIRLAADVGLQLYPRRIG